MGLKLASSLAITALFALVYAIVFLIGIWFLPSNMFGLLLMVGFTVLIILFQYAISPYIIGWVYAIEWMSYEDFKRKYPHLGETLDRVISLQGIKTPRMGIIHDSNPNAFTFGHTKNNARIVLTSGIIEFLNEKEQQAVLAHELGHVVHSDFILMTIVFAIPVILLTIARWAYYTSLFSRGGRDSEGAAYFRIALIAIAILSYVGYFVGYLLALIISRIREYYADEHSSDVLDNPNALATGLVKIAYGLVRDTGKDIEERNKSKVRALKGLGIFDPSQAKNLAVESVGRSGAYSTEAIQAAAAWDLYNPWAKYYQTFSTHPLPAKRIQRLNELAREKGIKPEIDLSRAEEIKRKQAGRSLMGEFLTDLTVKSLPSLIFILFALFSVVWLFNIVGFFTLPIISTITVTQMILLWAIGFYIIAFGTIIKTKYMYRSGFQNKKVVDLITNVKVSPIRPDPAIIEGKIIGKGIPGYWISDDLFFRDETGLLYVDYRFGLSIVDFFWAILRVKKLLGQTVRIKGWYRRGPNPYIQVDTIETMDGHRYRNYTKHLRYIWTVLSFIIAFVIFYFWLSVSGIL
jgi:Zn-dependent protease with chaperone function